MPQEEILEEQEGVGFLKVADNIIRKYYTPLLGQEPDTGEFADNGTGTFVVIGGKKGILTSSHVADIFMKKPLYVPSFDGETLNQLSFSLNVALPWLERGLDVDLAFLLLKDNVSNIVQDQLGKQFWDLDKGLCNWKEHVLKNVSGSLWVIHGAVAENKELIENNGKKYLFYKNAATYAVVPDLTKIEYAPFKQGELTMTVDSIICPIKTKNITFYSAEGMSGGALWKIIFNDQDAIEDLFLVGVVTEQKPRPALENDYKKRKKAKRIICRGPVTLYQGLYPVCLGVLYASSTCPSSVVKEQLNICQDSKLFNLSLRKQVEVCLRS